MALKDDVLCYLREHSDQYVSGEDLAKIFDKSRAAVWKAIKALQKEGYGIDAVTNRGYRFDENSNVLNQEEIEKYLDFACEVKYYDSIDSTNTQAKRFIAEGENEVMLVVANEQTQGRGRQGKSFYSPSQTGIYMSLAIHPNLQLQNAVAITTAASVAVCKAIEKLTDKKPTIKWVNDVYLDGKKICGILTEAVTDFETQTVTSVVIGVGVNVDTAVFPSDIENASCLGVKINRAELIGNIANELNSICLSGYEAFIEYYKAHSMIIGEDIVYYQNGEAFYARAVDINDTGALVVENDEGIRSTLSSGEITIRKR